MFAFLFWAVVIAAFIGWVVRSIERDDEDPVGRLLCSVPKVFTQPHLLAPEIGSPVASTDSSIAAASPADTLVAEEAVEARSAEGGEGEDVEDDSSAGAPSPEVTGGSAGTDDPGARRPLFDAPAERDDLKRISGIGPVMERHLNELGVVSFAQLAAFDEDDVARVDEALTNFRGRIVRDDWVGQARALVADGDG